MNYKTLLFLLFFFLAANVSATNYGYNYTWQVIGCSKNDKSFEYSLIQVPFYTFSASPEVNFISVVDKSLVRDLHRKESFDLANSGWKINFNFPRNLDIFITNKKKANLTDCTNKQILEATIHALKCVYLDNGLHKRSSSLLIKAIFEDGKTINKEFSISPENIKCQRFKQLQGQVSKGQVPKVKSSIK